MTVAELLLFARLLLAAVFAVAAAGKLLDLRGSRAALRAFGLSDEAARPVALLLPLAELAVAVVLLPRASARWGAAGALALLLVFATGIARALAAGRRPDCHCFGKLHSAPVGGPALVRNLVLAVLAAVVAIEGPGPTGGGWTTSLHGARLELTVGVVVASIVGAQSAVILTLLKRYGRALLLVEQLKASAERNTREELAVGELAPEFELPDLDGHAITLSELRQPDMPLLLVFSDPRCQSCEALLPQLARWQTDHADRLVTVVISRGASGASAHIRDRHGIDRVVLQEDHEVDRLYGIAGTPSAVVVDAGGSVASPPTPGAERILQLLESTLNSQARSHGVPGSADVRLPVLSAGRSRHAESQWQELAHTGG